MARTARRTRRTATRRAQTTVKAQTKVNTRSNGKAKKMNKNRRVATGIDIGTYSIKLATLVTDDSGQLDFRKVTLVPLQLEDHAPDNPAELFEIQKVALKEALKQHGHLDGTIVLGIPRDRVMIRYLDLPSSDLDEMGDMLLFDVERHVPYPANDLEISFQVIDHKSEHESHVMMAAIPKHELKHYINLCKENNVYVDMVLPNIMGDNYAYSVNSNPQETLALVNFGRKTTNLAVIRDKHLLFSRSINCSEESLLKGFGKAKQWRDLQGRITTAGVLNPGEREHFAQWVDDLSMELMRSMQAYSCQYGGKGVDRMILSGGAGYFPAGPPKGLNLKLKTKVTIESAMNGELPSSDAYQGTEMSTVAGLALCGTDASLKTLSLLPQDLIRERYYKQSSLFRKNVAILTIMMLLLLGGTGYLYWYENYQNSLAIEDYYQTLRGETSTVDAMRKKIETVENYIDHEHSSLNIIRDVLSVMPEQSFIKNITFEKRKSLQIQGQMISQNDINVYRQSLIDLKPGPDQEVYFTNVSSNQSKRELDLNVETMTVWDFNITCYIRWENLSDNNQRR